MGWVTINLPWRIHVNLDLPKFPTSVRRKAKAKFGKDFPELSREFVKNFGKEFWEVRDDFRRKFDPEYLLEPSEINAKMQKSKT